MPGCTNGRDWLGLLLLTAALGVGGCAVSDAGERFQLESVGAQWKSGRLEIRCQQRISLSSEARDALVHGVPLTLVLELILRDTSTQTRVADTERSYQIRYLPLSDHYQLAHAGYDDVRIFPRLRHVLSELSLLEVSLETGILPAGEYQLLARSRLDRSSMPPPMRLPALVSAEWRHNSGWSAWALQIGPEI